MKLLSTELTQRFSEAGVDLLGIDGTLWDERRARQRRTGVSVPLRPLDDHRRRHQRGAAQHRRAARAGSAAQLKPPTTPRSQRRWRLAGQPLHITARLCHSSDGRGHSMRRVVSFLTIAVMIGWSAPAWAPFHLSVIQQVYFGSEDCPDSQFVMIRTLNAVPGLRQRPGRAHADRRRFGRSRLRHVRSQPRAHRRRRGDA